MMTHAYHEMYLNSAQSRLADMFDYALNVLNLSGEEFLDLFLVSDISKRFEIGDTPYILGKSGIEMVADMLYKTKNAEVALENPPRYQRTPEYWIGWAMAYYQWYSNEHFSDIFNAISFEELQHLYTPLHEADITKFIEVINERMETCYPETKLKRLRQMRGRTQSQLAKEAEVNLRSIQMYEQRNKDINNASAITLYRISKVLNCKIEDLLETTITS